MKKYWKSTLLSAMIVLGIGTFYIQGALASKGHDFKLEAIAGDSDEVKDVQLEAGYTTNGVYETALIASDGTKHWGDYSYFEQLDGILGNQDYTRLLKDYKSFLRGKNVWSNTIYEDGNYLGYANEVYDYYSANPDNFSLEMAVLDKSSDEVKEFTYQLEDHMNVVGVIKSKDKLHVFADDELRVLTFDLNSYDLVRDEKLFEISDSDLDESKSVIFDLLNPTDSSMSPEYMIGRKNIYRQGADPIDSELIAYDLATEETQSLDLSERLKETTNVNLFDGEHLYFIETEGAGMTVITYDVGEQNISDEIDVDMDIEEELGFVDNNMGQDDDDTDPSEMVASIKDNHLYMGIPEAGSHELLLMLVVDMNTGETVYEGEVVPEESEDLPEEFHMEFDDMYVP